MTNATRLTKRIRAKSLNRILIPSLMHDIRKLEKCNGPVKVLITSCKSEQLWQAMSGRVNGKVQYCQLWELLLKRINSLFILRFLRLPCAAYIHDHGGKADIPTLDDFLCQETTQWSGLGVIDILAA